jgi:hypothetical protein
LKVRSFGYAVVSALLPALVIAGVATASASGKGSTITLHFWQKSRPVSPTGRPVVGDIFVSTDRDYVGNHRHHAKQWTATDHIRCVFQNLPSTGPATALCDGQIAIGGSMLLAEHVTATISQTSTSVPITGGTGKYRGYHGTAKSTSVSQTANDFTIVVRR